ncbi:receptor-type tyrosine-protein phosphatase mu-like [Xenia sp. Carnegie-2017]|uniref:receptor-type tyrosine-protein phosphatase mu-like n=1 Tax=Xenia sp. Carnegie-2017 TaxID=2897299 RepID=UPI001F04DA12|nr:receptor-type tyrosine-protein phosphatase mu-like [Xenia sp. Carnegie-2017]
MFIRYNYRKRGRNTRSSFQMSRQTSNVLTSTQENGHSPIKSPSDHHSHNSPDCETHLHRTKRKRHSVEDSLDVLSSPTKPIPLSNLLEYVKEHQTNKNTGFAEEFESISRKANFSYDECKRYINKAKNRYANIVTYDHTRVCLSNTGDDGSDYINANYIDGYYLPEKFIATQGPVAAMFSDFWRMVWEQNCSSIVMVTNLLEKGKVKCQKYWPSNEAELFGSISVNLIEEWELTDYTIRKFQIQQKYNAELLQQVTQFHYTAWPDHGVSVHPSRLLAFIKRIRNHCHITNGKILVHCSAGAGRTGAFIALDILLDQMKIEGIVDVYKVVSKIRKQRCSMVQTEAQYNLIYNVLLEHSIGGNSEIQVQDYLETLNSLEQEDHVNFLFEEFKNLNELSVNEKETCVNGLMPENAKRIDII